LWLLSIAAARYKRETDLSSLERFAAYNSIVSVDTDGIYITSALAEKRPLKAKLFALSIWEQLINLLIFQIHRL
jgi:hypothetical protein